MDIDKAPNQCGKLQSTIGNGQEPLEGIPGGWRRVAVAFGQVDFRSFSSTTFVYNAGGAFLAMGDADAIDFEVLADLPQSCSAWERKSIRRDGQEPLPCLDHWLIDRHIGWAPIAYLFICDNKESVKDVIIVLTLTCFFISLCAHNRCLSILANFGMQNNALEIAGKIDGSDCL